MRVAFIGTKGMPAVSGGVEAHVDELSRGLVRAGHEAIVYVRDWYTPPGRTTWGGVRLIHRPTIRTKHLDATVHCLGASLDVLFRRADVIHYHAIGPAFFALIPKLFGRRIVVTVHRRDWAADKWRAPARLMLRLAERTAVRIADALISISDAVRDGLAADYVVASTVIPNAFTPPAARPLGRVAATYGLKAGGYALFLGRLVPEKRPDWLIRAFRERPDRGDGLKLVIAGGASGSEGYVRKLHNLAGGDSRIVFTGEVGGSAKDEIFTNARLFVLPSRLEGHPLALLEAMGSGLACLVSDIPPLAKVVRDGCDGLLFRAGDYGDFKARLDELLDDPDRARELGRQARASAASRPDWDEVVRRTLEVYASLLR